MTIPEWIQGVGLGQKADGRKWEAVKARKGATNEWNTLENFLCRLEELAVAERVCRANLGCFF